MLADVAEGSRMPIGALVVGREGGLVFRVVTVEMQAGRLRVAPHNV